jgi:hypothetical protein
MKQIALLLALAASTFAQNSVPQNSTPPPTPPSYTVDCSTVNAPLSCRSFNEMVEKKDPDLLSQIKHPSFVCFRPHEDVFSIISGGPPVDVAYKKTTEYLWEAPGLIFYLRFNNGISEQFRLIGGTWSKFPTISPEVTFQSSKESDTKTSISDSELSLGYEYKNLNGSTTTYTIQIRRSTKRFVETYQYPDDPPSPEKNKGAQEKPQSQSQIQDTGYCTEFK